jgi:hypothetical protein
LGYHPQEEIGRRVLGYVHSDDMPNASSAFARLLREPGSIIREKVRVWHKEGSLRTLEVIGQNLLDNPAVSGSPILTPFYFLRTLSKPSTFTVFVIIRTFLIRIS